MNTLQRLKQDFKKAREEIFLGGVGGGIVYYLYAWKNNINPLRTFAMDSSGLIDKVVTFIPAENLATLKVMLMFVFAGIFIGALVGIVWNPFTFFKK